LPVENLQGEIWKDIPNYEGLYMASNFGRFKALKKTYYTGDNLLAKREKDEHILRQTTDKFGYLRFPVSKDGCGRNFLSHRMVAMLFVSNQLQKKEVNHIDGNKANNYFLNLQWCTRSENIQHAFDTGLKFGYKRGNHPAAKIILDTQTGIFYECMKDAAEAKGISYKNLQNRLLGIVINNTGLVYG